jgi:membrane dipeptidase
MEWAYSATAERIHGDLPVVDGHNDLPWALRVRADGDLDRLDPSGPLPHLHTDVPRLLAGGVGVQWWSVYVPADVSDPFAATNRQIDLVESLVARDPRLELAHSAAGACRIRAEGRIASLIGAEGGHAIENSLDHLRRLRERGLGYMTLTHSDTLPWADSATDEPRHGGLTDFGREVVREMNRLGVLVDVSHVSVNTMRDALDVSAAPIIASHSNSAALAPHPRNIPDDVVAAIGARGGVVMVAFFPGFVVPSTAAAMIEMFTTWRRIRTELGGDEAAIDAEMNRIEAGMELDRGTVADVVDHIEHIAAVAGIDAVGLGSDFDGMTMTPVGLEDVSCYPAITDGLLARGWSETEIRKVLGDNALRVIEAAEAVAAQ